MCVFICPLSGFWEVSTMTGGWESNHSVGELCAIYIYISLLNPLKPLFVLGDAHIFLSGWWFGTWILWLSIQLGMSSSQLTNSLHHFSEGWRKTTNQITLVIPNKSWFLMVVLGDAHWFISGWWFGIMEFYDFPYILYDLYMVNPISRLNLPTKNHQGDHQGTQKMPSPLGHHLALHPELRGRSKNRYLCAIGVPWHFPRRFEFLMFLGSCEGCEARQPGRVPGFLDGNPHGKRQIWMVKTWPPP